MNKKIFGFRIGTLISFMACLLVAFLIWLYANYTAMDAKETALLFDALHKRG